jgi:transposase
MMPMMPPHLRGSKQTEYAGRPQKSVGQQDMQCIHRMRNRLMDCRTQLSNQIRGLLSE